MKRNLKIIFLLALLILGINNTTYADSVNSVISLGADLTDEQKNVILEEFEAGDSLIIEVTNEEEHKYLGEFISADKIGSQALSNAKLTLREEGSGLNIKVSDKIIYINEDMFRNALLTAGITDADVLVSAPFEVTGTGALTGILKSYEALTGKDLPEEVKEISNEELVLTYDLSKMNSSDEVTDFMNIIKVDFAKNMPETKEEAKTLILNLAESNNVKISDDQADQLADLFMKMKNANIDWNKLADTAIEYSSKAAEFLKSDQGQSFLQGLKEFLVNLIDWIASLFK
ncbi:DUF1002 domain-containing protein [Neofamilia massiliensis]|uniref:DUF1002 domain-containing protein n=1 Tax=Neofamilia massiliensis TaxID=1673724 RepID=UPI0006BB85C0|nr:DUF1002 domain-containing protein [Neofamilia massiliensis]